MTPDAVLAASESPLANDSTRETTVEWALLKAIYTHKAEWNAYLAKSLDDDDTPFFCQGSLEKLENWSSPAQNWSEACAALRFAIEIHEIGDSDVIPAMMKATLGWLEAEGKRRATE